MALPRFSHDFKLAPAIAAVLLAGLVGIRPAAARCPAESPPPVRIDSEQRAPTVNRQRSLDDLRELAHSAPHELALGLYTGELRTTLKIDYQILRLSEGTCLRVSEATIQVVYTKRIIYLARELKRGSCQYNVALDHERHHARIDDAVLARELPKLRRAVADTLARIGVIGPVPPSAVDDERTKLGAALQRVVSDEVARIDQMRREKQSALDTPDAYRREAARCPGGLDVR